MALAARSFPTPGLTSMTQRTTIEKKESKCLFGRRQQLIAMQCKPFNYILTLLDIERCISHRTCHISSSTRL